MAKKEKFVVKKLLHFEPWMAEKVADIRFEKRMNTEAEAWRYVIERGLAAIEGEATKNEGV
ncbi:MAG: hypothetical protein AAF478_13250 [Pseudomonadota bacterium]